MATPESGRRRVDWTAAALALGTTLALVWFAYRALAPAPIGEPPRVGSMAPPLSLTDPDSREAALIFSRPGHVLWVSFWSARDEDAGPAVAGFDRTWRRFQGRRPFAMVVAVLDGDRPERWRPAFAKAAEDLPVFLASDTTRRAFGVTRGPLNVLIDGDGRVVAVARGEPGSLERMAALAERMLDEVEPPEGRFAGAGPGPVDDNARFF